MLDKDSDICVSWSGGKNSSVAVMLYLEQGYKNITVVNYIPYFKEGVPLIDLEHYHFIMDTAIKFENLGIKVEFVKGVTFFDWCSRKLVKGKHMGLEFGFPVPIRGQCGFARDSKIKACSQISKNFSFFDIGLCADELNDRKKLKGKELSILQYFSIKDSDCFSLARQFGVLSPKYQKGSRDGCLLCSNASRQERVKFLDTFPECFNDVLLLQSYSARRGYYPLRYRQWIIENADFISFKGNQLDFLQDYRIN